MLTLGITRFLRCRRPVYFFHGFSCGTCGSGGVSSGGNRVAGVGASGPSVGIAVIRMIWSRLCWADVAASFAIISGMPGEYLGTVGGWGAGTTGVGGAGMLGVAAASTASSNCLAFFISVVSILFSRAIRLWTRFCNIPFRLAVF